MHLINLKDSRFVTYKKQTYQNYELKKRQPYIYTLMKIADIFDVSLDYLCDRPSSNSIGFLPNDRKDTIKQIAE